MEPSIRVARFGDRNMSSPRTSCDQNGDQNGYRRGSELGKSGVFMGGTYPGSRTASARRGSLSMLAQQNRVINLDKPGTPCVRPRGGTDVVRNILDSPIFLGLTAVSSTMALLLAIDPMGIWQERLNTDVIRGVQLLLATGAAVELVLRLSVCGPSYCSEWMCLCDSFVIVGGVCLTASTRLGSSVLFLRMVRMVAMSSRRRQPASRNGNTPLDLDENPAVQLYQLVMRAVRETNVFTEAEKGALRRLLPLLAHQQIYVNTLQRGNEDYWKEYKQAEEKPRGRPSFAIGPPGADGNAFTSNGGASDLLFPSSSFRVSTASTPRGVKFEARFGRRGVGVAIGSAQDHAVRAVLAKIDQWDFDPFELEEITRGHPLVPLSSYLFSVKYNFFSIFAFSKPHFENFISKVEEGYGSGKGDGVTNIYHNRKHAADVTQAVHYFLKVCNLGEHLQDVEVAALLLGSLIHDFKHPGRSNAFLTRTGHNLALTYNDVSVLENYHLSEAFFLLRKDECNFVRDLDPAVAQEIRQVMVSMVLATDLKQHFDVLGEFNSHLADVQDGVMVDEGRSKTYTCAMKVCIKSADISHPARATSLHLRWTRDVIQEFFLQGDKEKSLGLEPSPLCDRNNTDIASSQKNFIGFLVNPLFDSWVSFLDCPAADVCTANLKKNEAMWVAKEKVGDNSIDHLDETLPLAAPPTVPIRIEKRTSSIFNAKEYVKGVDSGGAGSKEGGEEEDQTNGKDGMKQEGEGIRAHAGEVAAADVVRSKDGGERTGTCTCRNLEEGVQGGEQDLATQDDGGGSDGVTVSGTPPAPLSCKGPLNDTHINPNGSDEVRSNGGDDRDGDSNSEHGLGLDGGRSNALPRRRRPNTRDRLEKIFSPPGGQIL